MIASVYNFCIPLRTSCEILCTSTNVKIFRKIHTTGHPDVHGVCVHLMPPFPHNRWQLFYFSYIPYKKLPTDIKLWTHFLHLLRVLYSRSFFSATSSKFLSRWCFLLARYSISSIVEYPEKPTSRRPRRTNNLDSKKFIRKMRLP